MQKEGIFPDCVRFAIHQIQNWGGRILLVVFYMLWVVGDSLKFFFQDFMN
jgi:hypothetical protein